MVTTLPQNAMQLRDDNNDEATFYYMRAYTGMDIGQQEQGDNEDSNRDEEEVNITWRCSTWPEGWDNKMDYLKTHACRYKQMK
jgi:hypothetical protein